MSELTLKISADTKGLKEVKDVLKDIRSVVGSTSLVSRNFIELKRSAAQLKTEMYNLSATVEKMGGSSKKAAAGTGTLTNQIKKLEKENKKLTATVTKLDAKLVRLNKTKKKSAQASRDLSSATRGAASAAGGLWMAYGSLVPMMASYLTVSSAIKGISLAVDFEAQTVYLNAVAEATGDYSMSLVDLRKKLIEIKNVTDAPAELAEAAKELVKAGFSSTQAVSEMGMMSKTATVAQEELRLVTLGVAKQYRAWGVEAVGATRGVSTLSQTANMMAAAALSSATDFSELNQMLAHTTELGPTTAASFSQILAGLAHMSNMGIKGTKAATSLRTALLRLETMAPALKKSLSGLDIPFSAFTDQGGLKDLPTLFDDLGKSLKLLSEEERVDVLDKIFNLRALKGGVAMLSAMSKSAKEGTMGFIELEKSISDAGKSLSFVDSIYNKMSKSTKTQLAKLGAEISNTLTKSFSDSNGELYKLVENVRDLNKEGKLTGLIDGLAKITELTISIVVKIVKYRKVLLALGSAFVFGKIAAGIYAVVTALKLAAAAQTAFNVLTLMNPWVAGAAILGGALVYTALYIKDLKSASEATKTLTDRTKDLAQARFDSSFNLKGEAAKGISGKGVMQWDQEKGAFVSIPAPEGEDVVAMQKKLNRIPATGHEGRIPISTHGGFKSYTPEAQVVKPKEQAKGPLSQTEVQSRLAKLAHESALLLAKEAQEFTLYQAEYEKGLHTREGLVEKGNSSKLKSLSLSKLAAEAEIRLNQDFIKGDKLNAQKYRDKIVTLKQTIELLDQEYLLQERINKLSEEKGAFGGILKAGRTYIQEAADDFTLFEEVATNALKSTEDALVKFVETGKLSFKSLADSMVKDLTRIIVKKALAGMVSSAVSYASTTWFGGDTATATQGTTTGLAVGGPVLSGSSYLVGEHGPEIFSPSSSGNITSNSQISNQPTGVQVNIVNQGNEKKTATATSRYDDMKNLIIDVVLKDIGTGGPLRAATQGGRGV